VETNNLVAPSLPLTSVRRFTRCHNQPEWVSLAETFHVLGIIYQIFRQPLHTPIQISSEIVTGH
jgi:hypothetical protein